MKGWTRSMVWEDTGLHWIPTSPNIPTIGAARGYTATGILGEIGIESGIGSPYPFQIVAANGTSADTLAHRFNALHIPGVHASAYSYRTDSGPWAGSPYEGTYLQIDPRNAGNLTAINFQAIDILNQTVDGFNPFPYGSTHHEHNVRADERDMFDKVTGTTSIRRKIVEGVTADEIVRSWNSGIARWAQERIPFLLYGMTASHPVTPTSISAALVP
jgi:uncharacterized protein YbbC (DUF1343 family)